MYYIPLHSNEIKPQNASIVQPFFQARLTPLFSGNTPDFAPSLAKHAGEGGTPNPATGGVSSSTQPPKSASPSQAVAECDPSRPLTWNDYIGTVPSGATWGALTASGYRLVNNNSMIQAYFEGSQSWVMDKYKYPLDNSKNGCAPLIASCKSGLQGQKGRTASFTKPTNKCPATSAPPSNTATKVSECDSTFGKACTQFSVNESKRLLKHEQLHFQITCALVKKANIALKGGVNLGKISASLAKEYAACHQNYDSETSHGCNASKQAAWEMAVSLGLPKVSIP